MNDKRNLIGWALIAAYFIAVSLGHLEFSLWLVTSKQTWLGPIKPADYVPQASALLAALLFIYLLWRAYKGGNRMVTATFWLFWLNLVLLADLSLTFSVNEYFHYPQYGLLAWMIAKHMDPKREHFSVGPVLLITCLLGMADESLQYAYITISYSEYLDFNDFLINLLAAAAGMLAYYGFSTPMQQATALLRRHALTGATGFLLLSGILFSGTAALKQIQFDSGSDRLPIIERAPERYAHWLKGPHRGRYLVLDPMTASVLMALSGVLFSVFPLSLRMGDGRQ